MVYMTLSGRLRLETGNMFIDKRIEKKNNRDRKKIHIVPKILLIIFSILFLLFLYHWIKFQNLVDIFNKEITLGMTKAEVIELMGEPKPGDIWMVDGSEKREIEAKTGKEYDEVVFFLYESGFALRNNIIIYFDENNRIILKERTTLFTILHNN